MIPTVCVLSTRMASSTTSAVSTTIPTAIKTPSTVMVLGAYVKKRRDTYIDVRRYMKHEARLEHEIRVYRLYRDISSLYD